MGNKWSCPKEEKCREGDTESQLVSLSGEFLISSLFLPFETSQQVLMLPNLDVSSTFIPGWPLNNMVLNAQVPL